MKKAGIAAILLTTFIAACGLKSEGTKLTPIVEGEDAAVGKEYAITLKHVNVYYQSGDTMYIRAEDEDKNGIDIFFKPEQKSRIYNLEPRSNYIYKFKVIKGGKYADADLIEVADLEGNIISDSIDVPDTAMRVPFLDGKEGFGKEYTVKAKYRSNTEKDDGTRIAYFSDPDGYQFSLVGTYPEEMQEQIDSLEKKEYLVKIKRASELRGGLQGEILEIRPVE